MKNQPKTLNDFGGFDKQTHHQMMKVTLKKDPSKFVYCHAHTWYDASRLAQIYFNVGYDEVTGELLEGDRIREALGHTYVQKDKKFGGVTSIEVTSTIMKKLQ